MPPDDVTTPDEGQVEETEAPDTGQATESEESFADFDPSEIPDDADKAWFEQKYNELRSGFTQKTQGLAEERKEAAELRQFAEALENDPAARNAWLRERHGYQFDDGEGEEEYLDPEDELRARLERVEGAFTAQQQEYAQERQTSQALDEIAEGIADLEKSWGDGFEFEGKTLKAVQAYAEVHGPQAIPEIGEAMRQIAEDGKQRWIDSKKSPRRISQGTAANKKLDLDDREQRYKFFEEVAEEAADSVA